MMSDRTPPQVGEIWQHFKHCADEPHQYEIVCITEPGEPPDIYYDIPAYFTVVHTESGTSHEVLPVRGSPYSDPSDERCWLYPAVDEPCVIYTAVSADFDRPWARPLSSFMAADERSETGWKFWRITPHPPATE